MHNFVWKHDKSTIQVPVKINNATSYGSHKNGKLVCPDCHSPVTQLYRCEHELKDEDGKTIRYKSGAKEGQAKTGGCGKEYKLRDIKDRYDSEYDITYDKAEYTNFVKGKIDTSITVEKEIDTTDVLLNIELLSSFKEMYTNEDDVGIALMQKVYKWLLKHNKALLVSFGYRNKQRSGVIMASANRIVIAEFRDYRTLKETYQEGLNEIPNPNEETINAVSEDKENDLYVEFMEAKAKGEEIKIPKAKKAEKKVIASFLDE